MKDITVKPNITIQQAMKALNKASEKCLLVIDENKKLLGTLTDGDLRRSILSGILVSENISNSFNANPTVLVNEKYNREQAKRILRSKKLDLVPIIDSNGIVIDFVTWSILGDEYQEQKDLINVPVVIMAGGKGSRLEPFTKVLPKPLVPINERPIIEHIIEKFVARGCTDFYITINYKGRILKAYFDELQPKYNVYFIDEKDPLGTAGSLRLLQGKFDSPFFVTNCDIIIDADYNSIYKFHNKDDHDVTLVASTKEYIIPYGTCELNNNGHLSHIKEKPKYDFLINTGLYILNPNILELIPKDQFYHITHLIEDAKNQRNKVGVFPIDEEAWIDVGQWAEYQKAVEGFK